MPRLVALLLVVLLGAVSLEAAPVGLGLLAAPNGTVTAIWDANTDGVTVGYRLFYGLMPGLIETAPAATRVDTSSTSVPVAGLLAGRIYYFHVRAVDAAGAAGPSSIEVPFTMPGDVIPDPCAFPLGATSVSIFPTGKLNKTGSGGPGSKAFITFQAASPNSPVVFLSIRANGTDIPDSVTEGTNLRAPGSLWFTLPQMSATYSVFARNTAGCTRDQPTGFSTTVP